MGAERIAVHSPRPASEAHEGIPACTTASQAAVGLRRGQPLLLFFRGPAALPDKTPFAPFRGLPSPPDTGSTLSVMVSPGALGVSHTSDGSQSTWMGELQAGARIHRTRWDVDLHWEAVRGPGTFYRRAMESGWDRRTASSLGASRWRGRWVWSPLQSVDVTSAATHSAKGGAFGRCSGSMWHQLRSSSLPWMAEDDCATATG